MLRLLILLPILSLACGQRSLDLQEAPHIAPSQDPTVLGTIDERVGPIAVDAERLYWIGSHVQGGGAGLRSCRKEDCAGSLVTYDSNAAPAWSGGFRVQNGQIYWFHPLADPYSLKWSILQCDVSGCAAGARTVLVEAEPRFELAVASDAIYHDAVVSRDPASGAVSAVGLYRVPFSGNASPIVISLANDVISALSVHGDYVYWLEGQGGSPAPLVLRRVRASGDAPPETVAENVEIAPYPDPYYMGANALSLAFDSSYVYWNQGSLDGVIVRCPLTGCIGAPEVVVPRMHWPIALLLDGTKLYWLHDTSSQGFAVSSCTVGDCASRLCSPPD